MSKSPRRLTVDTLLEHIAEEYDALSKQLKVIARHIEHNRDRLGLEGIEEMAAQCRVQPSAIVRFAKHFGLSGFTEMQRIFRVGLARRLAPGRNPDIPSRGDIASGAKNPSSGEIADAILAGGSANLQQLRKRLDEPALRKAVQVLTGAETIWIVGLRRSFPVAAYLDHALQEAGKRTMFVSAMGGMQFEQLRSIRKRDALLAISDRPYADETTKLARAARERGAKLIVITDSRMAPLGRDADSALIVQDGMHLGFRSLGSTLAMAEALFIALAHRLKSPHIVSNRSHRRPAR